MISIGEDELRKILEELSHLRAQRDSLQAANTALVLRNREIDLRRQVSEFHRAFDIAVRSQPVIPGDDEIRLRLRLIAEEFFETLSAVIGSQFMSEHEAVMTKINEWVIRLDFPEFIDGLADLDYVIEGTRLSFGVNGGPIAAEVHRANMAKAGGEKRADGKIMKPVDWTPPDIERELKIQGWKP